MGFGEPEVRECLDLRVDRIGILAHETVARHAFVELLAQRLDPLEPAFGAHRPAQQIGILSGAVADRDSHLHELLLEHRNPEGALEHRLELRMRVGDLLVPELASHERMHRATLNRTGANESDLDHEVVEPPRLQAREQPHLRARLHLEHPDRIGPAQHVVDRRFLFRER